MITIDQLERRLKALRANAATAHANAHAYDGAVAECEFWLKIAKDLAENEAKEAKKAKKQAEKKSVGPTLSEHKSQLIPVNGKFPSQATDTHPEVQS